MTADVTSNIRVNLLNICSAPTATGCQQSYMTNRFAVKF